MTLPTTGPPPHAIMGSLTGSKRKQGLSWTLPTSRAVHQGVMATVVVAKGVVSGRDLASAPAEGGVTANMTPRTREQVKAVPTSKRKARAAAMEREGLSVFNQAGT